MWGYPEFYIPVPGGYGTESHAAPRPAAHAQRPAPATSVAATTAPEPAGLAGRADRDHDPAAISRPATSGTRRRGRERRGRARR